MSAVNCLPAWCLEQEGGSSLQIVAFQTDTYTATFVFSSGLLRSIWHRDILQFSVKTNKPLRREVVLRDFTWSNAPRSASCPVCLCFGSPWRRHRSAPTSANERRETMAWREQGWEKWKQLAWRVDGDGAGADKWRGHLIAASPAVPGWMDVQYRRQKERRLGQTAHLQHVSPQRPDNRASPPCQQLGKYCGCPGVRGARWTWKT